MAESLTERYISKSIVKGRAIVQMLHGYFRFPSSRDIVFGKETSVELVVIDDFGHLRSICDQLVFGFIKDIDVLPRDHKMGEKDLLVAISDCGKMSFLTFCTDSNRFLLLTHVELSTPTPETIDFQMFAIDSSGCFIAASAYEDHLALFSLSMSGNDIIIDKKIAFPADSRGTESAPTICGTVESMCFISLDSQQPIEEHNPRLALVLHRKGEPQNELILLEWKVQEQTITAFYTYFEEGPLIHKMVQVPNSNGLAFLLRAGDVLLMDLKDSLNPSCLQKTSLDIFSGAKAEMTYAEGSSILSGTLDTLSGTTTEKTDAEDSCILSGTLKFFSGATAKKTYTEGSSIGGRGKRAHSDIFSGSTAEKTSSKGSSIEGREKKVKLTEKQGDSIHILCWSWEPDNNRMIFCLDTGDLCMIEVSFSSDSPEVSLSESLYKRLACKQLLWANGGYIAAIVETGDGEVLKLEGGKLSFSSCVLNIAPILDVAQEDEEEEEPGQMFALCGVASEGTLRIFQRGISVSKLLNTDPLYQGVSGTWSVRMKVTDPYHSFIVLSFLNDTRVLSTEGLSDATDLVGFKSDACTLACGLVSDGLLVQICQDSVFLCRPTNAVDSEGSSSSSHPWWKPPDKLIISKGAVGNNFIAVSTSNPSFLFILEVRTISDDKHEISETEGLKLPNEISCFSIPGKKKGEKQPNPPFPEKRSFIIGTHAPSVEIWSAPPGGKFTKVACTTTSYIPQDVRLVYVGKCYVLAGLRNGMLLRFELQPNLAHPSPDSASSSIHLPTSATTAASDKTNDLPFKLQLIASRCIGTNPVSLVSLQDTVDPDIIALSGRPWLLQTAGRGISYTSLSIQHPSYATPVCMKDSLKAVLFVAEDRLHLVEMVHNKRLNMNKYDFMGTPRKVLYHNRSRMLLVMMESMMRSSVYCVNPQSGSKMLSFELKGDGRSMEFLEFRNQQFLVVGVRLSSDPSVKPNGEAESVHSSLCVFQVTVIEGQDSDSGSTTFSLKFKPVCQHIWRRGGVPLAICPYLDRYFLASAGNYFYVCGLEEEAMTKGLKVKQYATAKTRFIIRSLTTHNSRIAVGDGCDGVIFFSYDEDAKTLAPLYADPSFRLLADCILMDDNTAVVSDRKGSIAVLCPDHFQDNASPERNLRPRGAYFMGEVVTSIQKCLYSFPPDNIFLDGSGTLPRENVWSKRNAIIAPSLKGNITIFLSLSREEYELLKDLQAKLVVNRLTGPIFGNDHSKFRSRENPVEVPKILDGDMLTQFLELTDKDRDKILQSPMVHKLLEKVHYAMN